MTQSSCLSLHAEAGALQPTVRRMWPLPQGIMARCMQLGGPLLASGASERQAAQKLVLVVHSVCGRLSCSSNNVKEDVWVSVAMAWQ